MADKCRFLLDVVSHCSRQENSIAGMKASAKKKDRDYYDGALNAFSNARLFALKKHQECVKETP